MSGHQEIISALSAGWIEGWRMTKALDITLHTFFLFKHGNVNSLSLLEQVSCLTFCHFYYFRWLLFNWDYI